MLIVVAIILISNSGVLLTPEANKNVNYTEFLTSVKKGDIIAVAVVGGDVFALRRDSQIPSTEFPTKFDVTTRIPSVYEFNEDMRSILNKSNPLDYGITVMYPPSPEPSFLLTAMPYILSFGIIGVMIFFMMRNAGGGSKAMSFGKSKARMTMGQDTKKKFSDVAGADEEKQELGEIVEFLKDPDKFVKLGARIPKGVLLVGPPGCGKTLLAKAVAGEAKVPFFSISGSDFVEMFVGVGASRVRDLFESAKKNSPCIIFIDEIDAVGRHRGAGLGGGHDEREQTLNQLLVEMDGFEVNEGIIVIAATNRQDILDPALLRPGRFDRQIVVNYPDVKGREETLIVHAQGKPFDSTVDMKVLAKRTPGFTGADLENVLNEAAILTARRKKSKIGMTEIEEAINRVMIGPEKRSRVITDEDKRITALHEVGHALCAKFLPGCNPVHEVSIIPRGMAAGYTMTLPDNDNRHVARSKMLADIAMSLGGRVAEALSIGDICTGASQDLQHATEVAKAMVVKFGMSDAVGPIYLAGQEEVFIGRDYGHQKNYSEELAAKIDEEIRRIMTEAYTVAEGILAPRKAMLEHIAEVLIEREKIDGEELNMLLDGKQLPDKPEVARQEPEEIREPEPTDTHLSDDDEYNF